MRTKINRKFDKLIEFLNTLIFTLHLIFLGKIRIEYDLTENWTEMYNRMAVVLICTISLIVIVTTTINILKSKAIKTLEKEIVNIKKVA